MDTFTIFEEKFHSRDNTKILHPFIAYRLRFFYCATQRVFIEDHIFKKNDVNRTTLREVMRLLSQNLTNISF